MADFLENKCTFYVLNEDTIKECESFSCGHSDLDDFFLNDSHNYNKQLLGKSYCFRLDDDPNQIVCSFTECLIPVLKLIFCQTAGRRK